MKLGAVEVDVGSPPMRLFWVPVVAKLGSFGWYILDRSRHSHRYVRGGDSSRRDWKNCHTKHKIRRYYLCLFPWHKFVDPKVHVAFIIHMIVIMMMDRYARFAWIIIVSLFALRNVGGRK